MYRLLAGVMPICVCSVQSCVRLKSYPSSMYVEYARLSVPLSIYPSLPKVRHAMRILSGSWLLIRYAILHSPVVPPAPGWWLFISKKCDGLPLL